MPLLKKEYNFIQPTRNSRFSFSMKKAGVSVKHSKKFRITTDSSHNLPVAPNLSGSEFSGGST